MAFDPHETYHVFVHVGGNQCQDDTGDLSDPSTLYAAAGDCITTTEDTDIASKLSSCIVLLHVHLVWSSCKYLGCRHWTSILEGSVPGVHRFKLPGHSFHAAASHSSANMPCKYPFAALHYICAMPSQEMPQVRCRAHDSMVKHKVGSNSLASTLLSNASFVCADSGQQDSCRGAPGYPW